MIASIGPWRTALASLFGAILLGALCLSNELVHPVAAMAAFATAIAVIGAALIGWEHLVDNAESAGLVSARESGSR